MFEIVNWTKILLHFTRKVKLFIHIQEELNFVFKLFMTRARQTAIAHQIFLTVQVRYFFKKG